MTDIFLKILSAFIGTIAFGIIFNVRGKFLIFASLGGLFSISGFELLQFLKLDEALSCFIVSAAITLYSEFLARVLKTPTTTFIMTALVPLIPGSALYYTMSNALKKEWDLFFEYAYYAMSIALAISVGIIVVTTFVQIINNSINKNV